MRMPIVCRGGAAFNPGTRFYEPPGAMAAPADTPVTWGIDALSLGRRPD